MEGMETASKYACKSVFLHRTEELGDAFTELWSQLISEKENTGNYQNGVLQTNIPGL
ncbi:MAG: hypothetical protein NC429_00995 [Lachnospiraceae bacterium]|nr:hypothetical protein [Lachnospiraceae bacterium]